MQTFQQLARINVIMFYALVFFTILGFKVDTSLYSAVITGAVNALLTLVSVYTGPISWLIPSETFPLETRSAGQSVTVYANLLVTFIIGQSFLLILCRLKHAIFTFFSAWVVVMSLFVLFFPSETKNMPIEEMA
ncbi:hypothetical protein PR202_ga04588 [Eleusine coracana subsp. coracana]|uniref:Major facilitator superfamily (MFS) profile domain-containing protein n=1 Tax=Eleusine coracana subsp. coracana TaxID=191504 RepID=A0AAV5BQ02_ELECO|nr:hypothetical protein PR202_ga04588 [Eleusine coracana subsp. coracana]